jgi:hypothetical protein
MLITMASAQELRQLTNQTTARHSIQASATAGLSLRSQARSDFTARPLRTNRQCQIAWAA